MGNRARHLFNLTKTGFLAVTRTFGPPADLVWRIPAPNPRFCCLILALAIAACAGRANRLNFAGDQPGNSFFWSVHDRDGLEVGYLMGSLQLDRLDSGAFDRTVESRFEQCDALILEMAPSSLTAEHLRQAALKAPRGWTDGASEKQKKLVEQAASIALIEPQRLKDLPPWLARLTLVSRALDAQGYTPERGFEWHFLRRAVELSIPVIELETPSEQLAILAAGNFDAQLEFLLHSARNIETLIADWSRLHDAYQQGRVDRVRKATRSAGETQGELALLRATFGERDKRLADRIGRLFASPGRKFVLVDVGHLVGQGNIRQRLAHRGYVLRRIEQTGVSSVARQPLVTTRAEHPDRLPAVTMDFPPNVERNDETTGRIRGMQLIARVPPFRYVYTVSALVQPQFLDRIFGSIERGIANSGRFTRTEGHDAKVGGAPGRRHTFRGEGSVLVGAAAYHDGFIHTLGVVGPDERRQEIESRFQVLFDSFSID